MAVGEARLPTDNDIHQFIKKKIDHFKLELTKKNRYYGSDLHKKGFSNKWDSTLQFNRNMPEIKRVASHPATSTYYKDVERQRFRSAGNKPWTNAAGQTLGKHSRANDVLTKRSKGYGPTSSSSEKHSTGKLISVFK